MLGGRYAIINVCEGDCWSIGRELGRNVPFDCARGLEHSTREVSIPQCDPCVKLEQVRIGTRPTFLLRRPPNLCHPSFFTNPSSESRSFCGESTASNTRDTAMLFPCTNRLFSKKCSGTTRSPGFGSFVGLRPNRNSIIMLVESACTDGRSIDCVCSEYEVQWRISNGFSFRKTSWFLLRTFERKGNRIISLSIPTLKGGRFKFQPKGTCGILRTSNRRGRLSPRRLR